MVDVLPIMYVKMHQDYKKTMCNFFKSIFLFSIFKGIGESLFVSFLLFLPL